MPRNKPLTEMNEQHRLFVRMYIGEAGFNGTRAAELAGYKKSGCRGQAHILLRDPLIQKELATLAKPILEKAELSIDGVIRELAGIVHLSIADYFDSDGGIIPLADLSEPAKKAVKSMRVRIASDGSGDQILDLQFHDKMKAIALSMQKLGLLSDTLHQNADDQKFVTIDLADWEHYADAVSERGDIPLVKLDDFDMTTVGDMPKAVAEEASEYKSEKAIERDKVNSSPTVRELEPPLRTVNSDFDPSAVPRPTAKERKVLPIR